ncbi:C2H2-type zinc finger protein [Endozoicomonas sp. GU-1]|uniref:C2H2-type zinc finger protein n=1 Tax=Endozoicomonas sp. GU-1 TaxID=3009078 RepID=UPI0022B336DD|nr:C2H2-type zinc finger protein [Endozoicomonas sp. GU-1]WBA82800.1 C2H2-type zinc finger protein [Endozoicomonas sp. GU-1]
MNSRHVKASGSGPKIEAIAQFLLAKASYGQTASASASFNRQVTAQEKPYDPGIKRKQSEEKPVTQDLSEKRCTVITPTNLVAGGQSYYSSGPGEASQRCNFYPLFYPSGKFSGQNSQANEQKYLPSAKAALSLEERKVYQCTFDGCGKRYVRQEGLKRHLVSHTRQPQFKCTFESCEKVFAHKSSLKAHQRIHMGPKQFVCTVTACGKRFRRRDTLEIHERTHLVQKPFPCEIEGCNREYVTKQNLRRHKRISHHNYPGLPG